MKWRKLGTVFSPSKQFAWMQTHAQLPVTLQLTEEIVRIFFASRDEENRSSVAFVDVQLPEFNVVAVAERPALSFGPLGCFDDHGVYPASLVRQENELWLYYIGWNPGRRPPLFYSSIGLAISKDNGQHFERVFPSPIMSRSQFDPCLVTSPCVLREDGRWRMWYVSGFRWEQHGDDFQSFYHIKYAESSDGIIWERDGRICLDLVNDERNIARPCVIHNEHGYSMWFSSNSGSGYQLGYAESSDGLSWTRDTDEVFPQPHEVTSLQRSFTTDEVVAYPWVFEMCGRRYLLFNGNGFGRSGFSAAVEIQA